MWQPFDSGGMIGKEGPETGTIIRDEEHASGARTPILASSHPLRFGPDAAQTIFALHRSAILIGQVPK